jgi:hypothetical protein
MAILPPTAHAIFIYPPQRKDDPKVEIVRPLLVVRPSIAQERLAEKLKQLLQRGDVPPGYEEVYVTWISGRGDRWAYLNPTNLKATPVQSKTGKDWSTRIN